MRKLFIAGNWKMHKIIAETINLANAIKRELLDFNKVDIAICPPFTSLSSAQEIIMDTNIKLGAQDLYWESQGAFTGEVSAQMLKDCGCQFVIIGHSERRKYFFESDDSVNKKIKAALAAGLVPIVCVGETLEERQADKTIEVVKRQLIGGFSGLSALDMVKLVIAYEPVWAIGTGKTATPNQAQEVHKFIRDWLIESYSNQCAESIRILYGGSVKPSNTKELMSQTDIDGALVGGASLEADSFSEIVRNAS
jgi:triosephosphate isomerase